MRHMTLSRSGLSVGCRPLTVQFLSRHCPPSKEAALLKFMSSPYRQPASSDLLMGGKIIQLTFLNCDNSAGPSQLQHRPTICRHLCCNSSTPFKGVRHPSQVLLRALPFPASKSLLQCLSPMEPNTSTQSHCRN